MTNLLTSELVTAVSAVRLAARICQSVQRQIRPDVLEKQDKSPVTIADFASQAAVCRTLRKVFAEDAIVGEEDSAELKSPENAGFLDRIRSELAAVGLEADGEEICRWIDQGAGLPGPRFWTLDPIDGTKGFVRGEQYAISLALLINNRIELAVLGCPNLPLSGGVDCSKSGEGTLMYAIRGAGAFSVPISGDSFSPLEGVPVRTRSCADWSEAVLCESVESGHSSHSQSAEIAHGLGIRNEPVRLDSQAKYAVVARGDADAYLRLPTRKGYREKIWDHAGGVLVVEEAGGKVTDVTGQPLNFGCGRELAENRGVIVSSGPLHQSLIAAMQAAGV